MRFTRAKAVINLGFLSLALLPCSDMLAASCSPCGEVITNLPMPSYDSCGVAPFQNYVATYAPNGGCCSGRSGFYIGTGVGFGSFDYDFKVPGIVLPDNDKRSYMTEFLSVGYGYGYGRGCFFIGGELAYYYSSVTKSFSYEDESFITVLSGMGTVDQDSVTVAVCDPRVDIRSQNRVALDLLPGFTFASRFTIFARLGVEFSSYSWVRRIDIPDATMSDLVGVPIEFNVVGQEVTDKETDTIGGVRLGVGVSYVVSPNISLQLSWVHIATGTAEFVPNRDLILDAAPVIDNDLQPDDVDIEASIDTLLAKNTIKPTRNEVLLGVVFTF